MPLVGKKYKPGKGLLIYASAENLTWLNDNPTPEYFRTNKAWNRYRVQYEKYGRHSKQFFPKVGIQPITDGGLFAAGLFVAQKMGLPVRMRPRAFLETIAVSNWCKFSIKTDTNQDYITDIKKLTESLPYVINEISILQPRIVLIPKAIWRYPVLRAAMFGASPHTRFLAVPQFNAMVVNFHLNEYIRAAVQLKKKYKDTYLARWMSNLCRINKDNAWRYIAMLEDVWTWGAIFKSPAGIKSKPETNIQ